MKIKLEITTYRPYYCPNGSQITMNAMLRYPFTKHLLLHIFGKEDVFVEHTLTQDINTVVIIRDYNTDVPRAWIIPTLECLEGIKSGKYPIKTEEEKKLIREVRREEVMERIHNIVKNNETGIGVFGEIGTAVMDIIETEKGKYQKQTPIGSLIIPPEKVEAFQKLLHDCEFSEADTKGYILRPDFSVMREMMDKYLGI